MFEFNTPIEQKIEQRLNLEQVIWLTTVDSHHVPQPRPVWFHWNGHTILIFSQVIGAKVRHIANNPQVALNFNTDEEGGEVGVIIGEGVISKEPVPAGRIQAYLEKYEQGIQDIGLTPETMLKEYPVVVLVTPLRVRGF